ncbi:hypothetical protein N0B31_02675 [Salinirubellus salinus]|uniref:Uncharacterized protein n=1 Tax=Salinirubellus salinus TaxID=1364945 RepID=A0A9E7R5T3_9EURY|nr:hypothetical protein [Salinirubellus salinus]UWM55195.1 hypothetical protein N0B31_02675 [Salinirubellus salinus]
MQPVDERLLETLDEDGGWNPVEWVAGQVDRHPLFVDERLRMLADADLVAFDSTRYQWVHISSGGQLYLRGERRQELYPHPFDVGRATRGIRG